jgi:hypothetical protein
VLPITRYYVQTARKNSGTETKLFICSTFQPVPPPILSSQSLEHKIASYTHIDPNWALRDQTGLRTVLQLCCHESQHILATTEELNSSSIVNAGLCLVETFLCEFSTLYLTKLP